MPCYLLACSPNISGKPINFVLNSPRILFPSLSAKIGLYRAVLKQALLYNSASTVVGVDSNPHCPASDSVDEFSTFPALTELSDAQMVKELKILGITHVLPTRDAELSFWSEKSRMLLSHGIKVWVSDLGYINCCLDKLNFYESWRDASIRPIQTKAEIEQGTTIQSWVVKERFGSASRGIGLGLSTEGALGHSTTLTRPIFQPFVRGREFTAETWVSKNKKCHGVLLRWRTQVIDGESHETEVFKNPVWEKLLSEVFLHIDGARGHLLAQVLVDDEGDLHLIEINPRLGGASPLSLAAGLNSIEWSLQEEAGTVESIPMFPEFKIGMKLIKRGGTQEIEP